jgi:bifunctional non-homologous end joining protein LigD
MFEFDLPPGAVRAPLPNSVRLQVVMSRPAPPDGDGWLHEIKYDGHRLLAVIDSRGRLSLISRNGYDRTPLFEAPFSGLLRTGHELVIDGEIAAPDDRGVTHLDFLNEAIAQRQPERLAYYAFDLLHLDGHDLRRCRIEHRKEVLRSVLDEARCERWHRIPSDTLIFDLQFRLGAASATG